MSKKMLKPSTVLYTVPVVMASCGPLEKPNIITLAWAGVICSDPPMVSVSIRSTRYSYQLVKETGEFVLNLPTVDQLAEVDYCGAKSGRHVDKFAACQFTALAASMVKAPLIAECPIHLECRVTQVLALGTHDLFLARIVALQADEDAVNEQGDIDAAKVKPVGCLNRSYYRLGELVGPWGSLGKRLLPSS